MAQCHAISKTGEKCRATAGTGKEYCYFHSKDPADIAQMRECLRRKKETTPNQIKTFRVHGVEDLTKFLEIILSGVVNGKLSSRVIKDVVSISNLLIHLYDRTDGKAEPGKDVDLTPVFLRVMDEFPEVKTVFAKRLEEAK